MLDYRNIFFKKKILIYGLGKSGLSAHKFLKKNNVTYLYDDIKNNKEHLKSLKDNTAIEWRKYSTQCMIEILDNKSKV